MKQIILVNFCINNYYFHVKHVSRICTTIVRNFMNNRFILDEKYNEDMMREIENESNDRVAGKNVIYIIIIKGIIYMSLE